MEIATELVDAYHLLAYLGLADHTYTHLSCRAVGKQSFYLPVFGLRFEEVALENLLEVGIGERAVISGQDSCINITAYGPHADTYAARPHINAIFHLHTPEIVAVSAHPDGLLPISQWALHFYERLSYYAYDSLLTERHQSLKLLEALGPSQVLLMRHHGALILGRTIAEALYYTYHLQQACKTQCLTLASCREPLLIPPEIAEKSSRDLLSFEQDLGKRDWAAWRRLLQQEKLSSPIRERYFS